MKKKLNLGELRVESFETTAAAKARGTVHGHAYSDCCTYSCHGTCGASPPSDDTAFYQKAKTLNVECEPVCG